MSAYLHTLDAAVKDEINTVRKLIKVATPKSMGIKAL